MAEEEITPEKNFTMIKVLEGKMNIILTLTGGTFIGMLITLIAVLIEVFKNG